MHEFAPLAANVALNHTHACVRSVDPAVSPYWSENVCVAPDPEFGVTETAVTTGVAGLVTVQSPRSCQPLFCAPLVAYMNTFFAPANAALKLIASVSVMLVPASPL